MSTQSEQLKERTMQFSIDVLRLVDGFPRTITGEVIARQLARSATSVASNYRATCNARSRAEFIAKLGIFVEESDESEFWLDTCVRKPVSTGEHVERLRREAGEHARHLWQVSGHRTRERKARQIAQALQITK